MFGNNKKKVDKGFKKVDALVTGLVLGGIVASVYGIKKYEDDKKELSQKNLIQDESKKLDGKMSSKSMIKGLIFGFKDEKKQIIEKKPGIIKIVLTGIFRLISKLGKK